MSNNYLLYDPADFGAVEIREDTRDAEITRLREENARLRKALKPFANEAQFIADRATDDFVWEDWDTVTVGQIRAAAAAIREGEKDG